METDFIPLDYDYFDFNGRNYVKIIGRNSQRKRVCIIDTCDVYFWAILKEKINSKKINNLIEKIKKIKLDVKGRQTCVENVELQNKNFMGKKVKALKVFATNYKDLHDIADKLGFPEIECRRGYDLGLITHYIIERKINPLCWYEISGEFAHGKFPGIENIDADLCIELKSVKKIENTKFSPKVLAYDIETTDLKIGGGEILMVSLVSENFKKVITWKKSKNPQNFVEYVKNEAELIEKFVDCVKKISPDFLVGYFSDGFDLPYLRARATHLKIPLNLGLDDRPPRFFRKGFGKEFGPAKISGLIHIDILKFIQTAYSQYMRSETLSLNEVAKEFLGDEKKKFDFNSFDVINSQNWENYFEYCLQDSVLTFGLFDKFWPDMLEFSRIIKEPIFDISRNGLSKQVEGYILHNLERFNEIPEKRPTYDEIDKRRHREKVEGAFVLEPIPGLYENLALFDFTSMHTSIIITMNISRSTLLEKKEKDAHESPEIDFGGKKTKFYFSKNPGFIPVLMEEILEKRKKYKEEYKKNPDEITFARSNAFKLLSASVHGYIGFFGARYYSVESSASVLAFVRKFNKEIIEKVSKAGYSVIYGDTDSIAFLLGKKTETDVKKLLEKLNSELPGVMELELESFFKRGIWVTKRTGTFGAKKKYALIGKDGKIKIRGFETVRRDWCKLAREVQNNIIKLILEEGNEKKAFEYLKEVIQKVKKRKINSEDIIIKTVLQKPLSEYKAITPHVIAARKMKEKGLPTSIGNLVEYFIAESKEKKKLVREKVKIPGESGEYDISYYLERQVLPAVENIFQIFNKNVKEMIDGRRQTCLGDF